MRRAWSLRTRATCAAAVVYAVTLTGGGLLLVHTLEQRLTQAEDDLATARLTDLLDAAATGRLPSTLAVDDEGVAQVVDDTGEVVAESANIVGAPPISDLDPGDGYVVETVRAPDDDETETYRLWAGATATGTGVVTVYVGRSVESVSEATTVPRRVLWGGVPASVALVTFVTWVAIGRVLQRLDRLRHEVDQISGDELDHRVEDDGVADEVGRLATTMNAMLARLQESAERQRSFVADVSHDLQSPLGAQRVLLELAMARPDDVVVADLCRDALTTTAEMETLVADLLVLAQLDSEARSTSPAVDLAAVDLDDIVLEEAMRARPGSRVLIETGLVSAAPVRAEPTDLRRIVRNLLDNAVRHAVTRVDLVTRADGSRVALDVIDDGPGIEPVDHDRVFDRFFRADTARERGNGSGLGLPIARSLARRWDGDVVVVPTDRGAHVRLTLPPM